VFAHFEVRDQLDRVGRTGVLAKAAIDAAREIDAESLRVPAAAVVFGLLHVDAVHGTGDSAQVAGNAALGTIRVARQDDAAAIARRQIHFFFRILHRVTLAERMHEGPANGA